MVANEEILRLNQIGVEATRGTNVAATHKLYAILTPNFTKALREFVDTTGTYEGRRRKAFQREIVTFGATDLATFEDLPRWWELLLKGGATPGADAGTPIAYTRPYVPSLATDDLKSWTLEWNHVGNAYESSQVMGNTWTLRVDPDNEGAWVLDAELMARDLTTTTHTAAIPDRLTEVIPAPGTKMYINDTYGALGTTQLTDHFISASISGNNNLHFKGFAEHINNFAANKVGRGLRAYDAQFVLEFDNDTEFAKMRAGADRFIRLESEGSIIHDAIKNRARVDMNGPWTTIAWGNREGNIIATFGLAGYYNPTAGYSLRAEVVNSLALLTT
jgi:hypothetical protein